MKTIRIAHLYYDLMNLYGEAGNVLALESAIKKQGLKAEITRLTKGHKIEFENFDIFYMGMGSEKNQEIVREDILKFKKDFRKYIDKKIFIMTGNAFELFGKKIDNKEALGIFGFSSKKVRDRLVGEQINKTYLIKEPIIGFQNRISINNLNENHFFDVITGNTDNKASNFEGITVNNFYGTYTLGPLLIRNPYLLEHILKTFLESKNMKYKPDYKTTDFLAYEEYLKNFKIKRD